MRASRSCAIHYKINDEVCGFHPVLYATLLVIGMRALRLRPSPFCIAHAQIFTMRYLLRQRKLTPHFCHLLEQGAVGLLSALFFRSVTHGGFFRQTNSTSSTPNPRRLGYVPGTLCCFGCLVLYNTATAVYFRMFVSIF